MYSDLGRIKKIYENNNLTKPIIAVAGCVAQAEGKEITKRSPWVDLVVGPQAYTDLPKLIKKIKHSFFMFPKKSYTTMQFIVEATGTVWLGKNMNNIGEIKKNEFAVSRAASTDFSKYLVPAKSMEMYVHMQKSQIFHR